MADPSILSTIGVAASVAGVGLGAYSMFSGGEAKSDQAMAQAQATAQSNEASAQASAYLAAVARNNAIISRQNAEYERAVGDVVAAEKTRETTERVSSIRAWQGARGVDVNTGSTAQVQDSQRLVGALDAATILSNAARKAYGYTVEGVNFENEGIFRDMTARAYRAAGGTALDLGSKSADAFRTAGGLGAAGSILGGVSSVSDKWLSYKSKFGDSLPAPGSDYNYAGGGF